MAYARRFAVVIALVCLTLVCAVVFSIPDSEPQYAGKGIRQWVVELRYGTTEQSTQARIAIKNLGQPAVPYLIRMLEKKDSRLDVWLRKAFKTGPYAGWLDQPAASSHAIAAVALCEIGPTAGTAVPALQKVAQGADQLAQDEAKAALMVIRSERTEGLAQALLHRTQHNRFEWFEAARIGSALGEHARPLIPFFVNSLKDTDPEVRYWATTALGTVALDPEVSVPPLIVLTTDSDLSVRRQSLFVLHRFTGAAALARAQPDIQRCLADPDQYTRYMALFVLTEAVSSLDANSLIEAVDPLLIDPDKTVQDMAKNLLIEARKRQR